MFNQDELFNSMQLDLNQANENLHTLRGQVYDFNTRGFRPRRATDRPDEVLDVTQRDLGRASDE